MNLLTQEFHEWIRNIHGLSAYHGTFGRGQEFTAIAGQNDMMAIGALDALHEARFMCRRMSR